LLFLLRQLGSGGLALSYHNFAARCTFCRSFEFEILVPFCVRIGYRFDAWFLFVGIFLVYRCTIRALNWNTCTQILPKSVAFQSLCRQVGRPLGHSQWFTCSFHWCKVCLELNFEGFACSGVVSKFPGSLPLLWPI
jgi:hypothetical protein